MVFFFAQFCEEGGVVIIHKRSTQIWLHVKEESIFSLILETYSLNMVNPNFFFFLKYGDLRNFPKINLCTSQSFVQVSHFVSMM